MKAVRRLVRDESGMTMGLVVITMALIGVMGAGLLVFVQRDLESVLEVNQGQKALEMADAGVQAAEEQLYDDSIPNHYNGGSGDVRWSSSSSGMTLTNLDGNSSTADSVHVSITYQANTVDTFVVISTGTYGDAKRKIEAVFTRTGAIQGIPPGYFSRNNLSISGTMFSTGISFFALEDATVGGTPDFGLTNDTMKKWAETNDSGSFPNPFNNTPRGTALPGVGAGGTLTTSGLGPTLAVQKGTRSFDKNTNPQVVPHYYQSSLAANQKIAFPFSIDSLPGDIEVLRAAAQRQEAADGQDHYIDNLTAGTTKSITSWPSNTTYESVYFYRFPTWDSRNEVVWAIEDICALSSTRKGVIVVENGDFKITANHGGFMGTVFVYGGTDPATEQPYPDRGRFTSSGTACMAGYATATGDMTITGTYLALNVPGLTTLPAFAGGIKQVSWRELYG
jgi:hypothetical protein